VSTATTADFQRKDTADRIAQRLTEEGHSVASLHGDKMTNERDGILDAFRDGKTKVLITTNVVARGIDIQQVNMVVNYDVPDLGPSGDYKPDIETYIHRIGQLSSPRAMSKADDQDELVDLDEKDVQSFSLMIRGLWRMFSISLIPSRSP
jgi:superfamily II DNA/RNA helicase